MLIKCPDCEGTMSDSARACPHCGYDPNILLTSAQRLSMGERCFRAFFGGGFAYLIIMLTIWAVLTMIKK